MADYIGTIFNITFEEALDDTILSYGWDTEFKSAIEYFDNEATRLGINFYDFMRQILFGSRDICCDVDELARRWNQERRNG
jgi:hypothetical protein